MKNFLIALMLFISMTGMAQYASLGYKMTDDYQRFSGSTTYVVLTDNAAYDSNMVHAVKKYWTLTPYKFINYKKDLNKKIRDKKASFLLLLNMATEESEDLYNCLALVNGGKPTLSAYEFIDMLAYCPTNHFQNELVMYDCSYRVKNMVQSIISTLNMVQKSQMKGDLEKMREMAEKNYRAKASKIKDRILLISPEIIGDKIDEDDFKKTYPHKTEFCKKETIEKMIASGDSSFYYLLLSATAVKSVFVVDPSNGDVLYADHGSGKYFAKDDLKDLTKAIDQALKLSTKEEK